ncbi:hypothetical protein [Streptomyces gelaticus]|uniref:hypothetical protein n=1 Tax=Streptomyces gelaticus TaxID=285446 RepID=UPI001E5904E5|nr:hypothetical protein [Streptomyces gelaticus]
MPSGAERWSSDWPPRTSQIAMRWSSWACSSTFIVMPSGASILRCLSRSPSSMVRAESYRLQRVSGRMP